MSSNADLGFTFHPNNRGEVRIYRHGRPVIVMRGRKAQEFLADIESFDETGQQQLMARATGNYKHGNERTAKDHPRNRK